MTVSTNTKDGEQDHSRTEDVARLAAYLRQHGCTWLHFIAIRCGYRERLSRLSPIRR